MGIGEVDKMKNYNLNITEERIFINEIPIRKEVFDKEFIDYLVGDRKDLISNLYMWIEEATGSDRINNLNILKKDLHYLESLDDEFIFSSIFTNEYICKSDNLDKFNEICENILKVNQKVIKNEN